MTWPHHPAFGLPRFRPCFAHASVCKTGAAVFQNHASVKHGRWHRRCTSCSHPHAWQRAISLSLRGIRTCRPYCTRAAVQRAGNRLVVPPQLRNRVPFDMRAAEGEIKGRGTSSRGKQVCTWGWRGTRRIRHRAVEMREAASMLAWVRATYAATRLAAPERMPEGESTRRIRGARNGTFNEAVHWLGKSRIGPQKEVVRACSRSSEQQG